MAKLEHYGYEPAVLNAGSWLEEFRAQNKVIEDESAEALTRFEKTNNVVGCYWRHPVADGYALYRITKARPLTLQHVPAGDGYAVPDAHIRGLNIDDIKDYLDGTVRRNAIFNR